PEAHWCGANWVEMTMFVVTGLRHYGYYRLAAEVAHRNCKMVFDELERYGHFREYFNSITGSGAGLADYIWTGMPAYFIISVLLGIEPAPSGVLILPALPDEWSSASIENLRIRGRRLSVRVTVEDNLQETIAKIDGKPVSTLSRRGVMIPWDVFTDGLCVEILQPRSTADTPTAPIEL
ncbi:MAG: glycosyl hydrolase family 65 protein, partial [Armatimonadota bacterium]|nr:glycosyl hydrolase family 65 protein [Armatimonadota bacterium]